MKDLTFDEYELLSDDEKMKYHKEFPNKRTNAETLKDLDELSESILKKIIRNKE